MILNFLFMASNQAFLTIASPIARSLNMSAWQMGLIISMVGIIWVVSVRFWGKLSDRYGRIGVLLYALIGFMLSCVVLAIYVGWALSRMDKPSLSLTLAVLLFTRVLIGFFAANIPITINAWIADNYAEGDRIRQLAKVGAIGGMGMVLSPFVAGLLGHYDLALTLMIFAILPAFLLPFFVKSKEKVAPINTSNKILLSIKDRRIFTAWLANLVVICAIIIPNECLGFYLIDNFGMQPAQATIWIGIILSATGIAFAVAQLLLSKFKNHKLEHIIGYGALCGAIGFLTAIMLSELMGILIGYLLSGFGIGLILPSISALAMNKVGVREHGDCASILAMAQGLAIVIAPVAGTVLYDFNHVLPFVLIILLLLVIPWLINSNKTVS